MKIEIDTTQLNIPEGWEATGEFRKVMKGESFLSENTCVGDVLEWVPDYPSDFPRFIVQKSKQWRPMEEADMAKILQGPFKVRARMADDRRLEAIAFYVGWARVNPGIHVTVDYERDGQTSCFATLDIKDVEVPA